MRLQDAAPELPPRYSDLGPATGKACGFALLILIPIGSRSTIDRAFVRAVESVPGARSLREVKISERWTWTPIGMELCATIQGTGIGPA